MIEAPPDFFAVTKRIHNRLHGTVGDGGALDDEARAVYEQAVADNLPALADRVRPENAIIVNALQRHATVVAQKSLAEGFGLTVAEAMWKARPVIASRIGGIQSQIVHGVSGVLLDDPRDLQAFGDAVTALLEDPQHAEQLGENARARVRDQFTSPRSLLGYLGLIQHVVGRSRVRAAA